MLVGLEQDPIQKDHFCAGSIGHDLLEPKKLPPSEVLYTVGPVCSLQTAVTD